MTIVLEARRHQKGSLLVDYMKKTFKGSGETGRLQKTIYFMLNEELRVLKFLSKSIIETYPNECLNQDSIQFDWLVRIETVIRNKRHEALHPNEIEIVTHSSNGKEHH